ncbi:hypothetical protein BDZ97DRAFT_1798594, partial [Flammula alnicola]
PSPSCVLFPRRADGKVILPNPLDLVKDRPPIIPQKSISEGFPTVRARTRSKSAPKPCSCKDCVRDRPVNLGKNLSDFRQIHRLKQHQPTVVLVSGGQLVSSSTETTLIQNYAQLSSLPEFKAFKLNQEGQLEARPRAPNGTSEKKKGSEWMQEIRVIKIDLLQKHKRLGAR